MSSVEYCNSHGRDGQCFVGMLHHKYNLYWPLAKPYARCVCTAPRDFDGIATLAHLANG